MYYHIPDVKPFGTDSVTTLNLFQCLGKSKVTVYRSFMFRIFILYISDTMTYEVVLSPVLTKRVVGYRPGDINKELSHILNLYVCVYVCT